MTEVLKTQPNQFGNWHGLMGNMYDQLMKNRIFQDKEFTMKNLSSMNFDVILETVLEDKEMFKQMTDTFYDHMKTVYLPGAKPWIKLGVGAIGTYMIGPTWGVLIGASADTFIDKVIDSFAKPDISKDEKLQPGRFFYIDTVKLKSSKYKDISEQKFTLAFFVEEDTIKNKLLLFVFEFGKTIPVEREFCRALTEGEAEEFDTSAEIQFVKQLFLLRHFEPEVLQQRSTFEKGSEVIYNDTNYYVVDSSDSQCLLEDRQGKRFEINVQDIKKHRSHSFGKFYAGDWVIIPTDQIAIPKTLACISSFIEDKCVCYEGKQRILNVRDLSRTTSEFRNMFNQNSNFSRFKTAAFEGRADIQTLKIDSRYWDITYLRVFGIKFVEDEKDDIWTNNKGQPIYHRAEGETFQGQTEGAYGGGAPIIKPPTQQGGTANTRVADTRPGEVIVRAHDKEEYEEAVEANRIEQSDSSMVIVLLVGGFLVFSLVANK